MLIVLPGALGDVVRALPLLGRLRRAWPAATLAWAVEPLSAPLLEGHPWLDETLVFARDRGARAFVPFLARVRRGRFDVALDLGRSAKSAVIAWASGARERLAFGRRDGREGGWLLATRRLPPQDPSRPKLEHFLAFGDALGLPAAPIAFGLAPTAAEEREAAAFTAALPRPLVAACVGSSCPSRRWFPERMAALLEQLGTGAVVLGAASDAAFAAAVLRAVSGRVRDLVGRTTLRQLLAVLACADVAVGPDSGALHLAAAVGTPAVSLWGATSALRSAPFGSERFAVQGSAPCAPCFLRTCPIDRVCMQAISVAAVQARVVEALAA